MSPDQFVFWVEGFVAGATSLDSSTRIKIQDKVKEVKDFKKSGVTAGIRSDILPTLARGGFVTNFQSNRLMGDQP